VQWHSKKNTTEGLLPGTVKRLAAETAMKRLRAKLNAVDAQFPLEGEAKKSQRKINNRDREAAEEKISQVING